MYECLHVRLSETIIFFIYNALNSFLNVVLTRLLGHEAQIFATVVAATTTLSASCLGMYIYYIYIYDC